MPSMSERDLELVGTALRWLSPVLLALGVWYFWPGARRRLLPPQRQRAVPWTAGEVLVAFGLWRLFWPLFVTQLLMAIGFLAWFYGPEVLEAAQNKDAIGHQIAVTQVELWIQTLALPLEVVSILLVLYGVSGTRPYQLGLTSSRAGRNVLVGVLAWVTLTPFVFTVNWLASEGYRALVHLNPEEHPLTQLGRGSATSVEWILLVLTATVAAPVTEELFFRGVVQPWLSGRTQGGAIAITAALGLALLQRLDQLRASWPNRRIAELSEALAPVLFVLLMVGPYLLLRRLRWPHFAETIYGTALFFAAAHSFAWPTPIPLFVLGLCLGYLAYRTQSLVPAITLHALFNGVSCVVLLVAHFSAPAPEPENGSATTSAPRLSCPTSTSTAVPGSWLPRRRYARASGPSRGDTNDDVTWPTSLPERSTRDPAGTGPWPSSFKPSNVRLTWPRSRAMTIGSWPR
jgi:membrane protease YdiL (CAAX protease family)